MNRQKLNIKLDELNVPKLWYSLDGEEEACEYFYQMMKKIKERTDRINKMSHSEPLPTIKHHTFTVSETGEIEIQKEKN